MLKPNSVFSSTVTSPSRPSVARKAKASGTPAKFEATPEKVSSVGADPARAGRRARRRGEAKPISAPSERRGDADLDARSSRRRRSTAVTRSAMFSSVKSPVGVLEGADHQIQRRQDQEQQREDEERRDAEPVRRQPQAARRSRRRSVAGQRRMRNADVGHRRLPSSRGRAAASRPARLRLTGRWRRRRVSQFLVIASLAAPCSSSVGNTAAS